MPTFPNARYLLPKADYDFFNQELAERPSALIDNAFTESVEPIIAAGLADFITEDMKEVARVLEVEPAPGHSPGMLTYRLRSGREEGLFTADVMHSPLQIVKPDLNTSYCALPDVARATRREVLNRAADRESADHADAFRHASLRLCPPRGRRFPLRAGKLVKA